MKKLISMILVMVVLVSLAVPSVFAAVESGTGTDSQGISISVDTKKDASGNAIGVKITITQSKSADTTIKYDVAVIEITDEIRENYADADAIQTALTGSLETLVTGNSWESADGTPSTPIAASGGKWSFDMDNLSDGDYYVIASPNGAGKGVAVEVSIVNKGLKAPLAIAAETVSGPWTYGTEVTKTHIATVSGGTGASRAVVKSAGDLPDGLTISGPDANGKVYIAGTPEAAGTAATITLKATDSEDADGKTCTVTLPAIGKAKLSISANPATASVSVDGTKDISGQFKVDGVKGSDKPSDLTTITYASGTPANATVDTNGVVIGVAVGNSVITATLALKGTPANYELDTTKTATVTVTVQAGEENPITIGGNKNVTYGDADFTQAATQAVGDVTYSSSDSTIAAVDPTSGKVTIKKAGGPVTITASAAGGPSGGKTYAAGTATYTVTVEKKALTVEFGSVEGKKLSEVTVTADNVEGILPADTANVTLGAITWKDKDGNAVADPSTVTLAKGDSYTYEIALTGTAAGNYVADGTLTLSSGGSGIVIGGSKQTYTVTYNVGSHGNFSSDASTTEKVAKNETPKNVPVVHPHDNYRFMGWTLDGKTIVDPTTQKITKNVTFTALYEACDHMAYMVGRSDTQFAPNGNLTRAEAATILSRLTEGFDENGTYPAAPYSDLNTSAWYAKYVNFAASKGIVNGRPDGTFDPDASITRAEFATMIANFAGVGRVEAPSASNDVAGHWAAGYIVALERANIVTGYEDGTFRPNANITRAEAATMVNGAIDRTPDTALDLAANSYTNPFTDVTAGQWFFAQVMEATVNHVTAHFHTDK